MLAVVRRNSVYSFFQYKLKNEDNKVRHVLEKKNHNFLFPGSHDQGSF